ncbi:UDP-2,3-diacylglucosamine diphosphatase [Aquabacterium sp. NJ1]|uniref:UDP-2,3-diacylglucosamine diphosphatase n=1 Tax=Aquabacterium sp. NJ1 TaxID=1538295 RepID=UPI000689381A|nr:UDP-2,3-diacylglucosamine diphosphatase [Aquabacterium sp. NJ1]
MPDVRGPCPPFPQPDILHAPPSWRCIDFISDLHLHEGLPRTTRALADYLGNTPADAVFMLGDVFEAWVGDDMRGQPYEAACVDLLAKTGARLHLAIMVGNRDFLLGDQMLAACRAHKLHDPTVLHAFGRSMLLIHGDELCLSDQDYLKFRAQVRNPLWQQGFLAHPLEARLAQARQMREASQMHQHTQTPADWADVDESAATLWMKAAGATALIHGHTHHPGDEAFGPTGAMRHVLSDWDLDHGAPRAEVLRLSESGFQRIPLPR